MDETYDVVITVQVKIPAALIEGDTGSWAEYDKVEDTMLGQAELQLQETILGLRGVHARG